MAVCIEPYPTLKFLTLVIQEFMEGASFEQHLIQRIS